MRLPLCVALCLAPALAMAEAPVAVDASAPLAVSETAAITDRLPPVLPEPLAAVGTVHAGRAAKPRRKASAGRSRR